MKPLVPVGPRYGWVVVATLTVLLAVSHGLLGTGITVFDTAILADLHVSRAALKLRDVVQLVSGGLWAMAIGFAADRVGPRPVIYAGLAVLSLALFAYGHVTTIGQVYALHVALAFAYASCTVVVVVLVLTRWFSSRRATALGLILAGESLGGSLLPPVIALLIGRFGWRGAMEGLALLPLGLALMVAVLLRDGPERDGPARDGPEPESGMPAATARFGDQLRSGEIWLLLGIAAALFYAGGGVAAHSFLYFSDRGFDRVAAAASLSLVFIGAFIGKSSSGFLAERWPGSRVWLSSQALLLAGVACLSLAAPWSVWPGVAMFGFGWGASYTLTQAQVMERWRGPFLGRLTGLIVLIEGLAAGLGSWLGGWFHDQFGSYTVAYAVMTGSVALALSGSLLLQRHMGRRLALG